MFYSTRFNPMILKLYHSMFGAPDLNMHLRWRAIRRLVSRLRAPVLDVGCGKGAFVIEAVKVNGGYVVGFDVSRDDIHLAKNVVSKSGIKSVDLLIADARKMPFKDKVFGSEMLLEVLEHIDEDDLVLDEASRVLMNDGHMIVTAVGPGYTLYSRHPIFSGEIQKKGFFREMDHVRDGYTLTSLEDKMSRSGLAVIGNQEFVGAISSIGVRFLDYELNYLGPFGFLSRYLRMIVLPIFLALTKIDPFIPSRRREFLVFALREA